jgi:hypothetical protein
VPTVSQRSPDEQSKIRGMSSRHRISLRLSGVRANTAMLSHRHMWTAPIGKPFLTS